jgi:hypothetical protein
MTETVKGWRAFAVGDGGTLVSPFLAQYWPDLAERVDPAWTSAEQTARCLAIDHPAPNEDCTCGLRAVVSYPELLKAIGRPFVGGGETILERTGAVGPVELSGRIELGVDMPDDDPPTTKRGERARLLEVFPAPALAGSAAAVEARYEVPARVEQRWPEGVGRPVQVSGEAAFLAAVHEAGFGHQLFPKPDAVLVSLGREAAAAIRAGVPTGDIRVTLLRTGAGPTREQVDTFVRAAVASFAPECEFAPTGTHFSTPLRVRFT